MRRVVFWSFFAALLIWLAMNFLGVTGQGQLESLNAYLERFVALQERLPKLIFFGFALAVFLSAVLGLPPPGLLTVVGAAVLGFVPAILISLPATIAGSIVPFFASRYLLQPIVHRRFAKQARQMQQGINQDGPWYLFSLRLVPLVPFPIVNLIMGITSISLITFVSVSFIGRIPLTLLYGNAGMQLAAIQTTSDIFTPQVTLSLAALALFPHLVRMVAFGRLRQA